MITEIQVPILSATNRRERLEAQFPYHLGDWYIGWRMCDSLYRPLCWIASIWTEQLLTDAQIIWLGEAKHAGDILDYRTLTLKAKQGALW